MKLRNKKTGQEGNFIINKDHFECVDLEYVPEYRNLAELNEEWEDCKSRPYIVDMWEDDCICDAKFGVELEGIERAKECGLYFKTKEEAEKAVEKLKAWKRLQNKGFRFTGWATNECIRGIDFEVPDSFFSEHNHSCISDETRDDLDLLFGGKK